MVSSRGVSVPGHNRLCADTPNREGSGQWGVLRPLSGSLDFMNADGEITPQHYAFLVSESEFDKIFGRVHERSLPYWADPAQTRAGEINHHDGGRGFYFEDPNGHFLEVITRPYGSGGSNP
jgi:hypothetical protein